MDFNFQSAALKRQRVQMKTHVVCVAEEVQMNTHMVCVAEESSVVVLHGLCCRGEFRCVPAWFVLQRRVQIYTRMVCVVQVKAEQFPGL